MVSRVAAIKPREGILFGNAAIGVSLIGGLGVVTPFNTAQGSPEFDLGNVTTTSGTMTANVTNLFGQFQNTPSLQSQYLPTVQRTECLRQSRSRA